MALFIVLMLALAQPQGARAASASRGASLYASACASCHGGNPALGQLKILKGKKAPDVIAKAINGNIGGMGYLSSTVKAPEIAEIAAYLGTF